MKLTIEICCDEAFGERRGDKVEAALALCAQAVREALENAALLTDARGTARHEIRGPLGLPAASQAVVGHIVVEG
jgi:hypothetical protein